MQQIEEYKSDMKKLKVILEERIDYRTLNAMFALSQYILRDYPDERKYCFAYSKAVKDIALQQYAKSQKPQWDEMYWQVMLWEARNYNIDSYFLYVEKNREPERKFYLPRRKKFLQFGITQSMQDLLDDKIDLLTISMCPGSGKSTAGIFLLSGVMGWWPEEPNLASAHSGILTRSFYDGVSQILNPDGEYTWHEIFPNVKFNIRSDTNSKEQTINVGEPKRFKSLTCRAIGASLTGATRCEKILYADDLCSGIEEALSKDRLDKLWQTYNTDLKTRKKKFCKEIHIQTRWSVHDVVGRLQRDHEEDKRARFISIPALNESEESNFDYDYNVGFDTKYFLDMKQSMDDVSFKCLFMNQPIEREGLLYHDDDFERYYELPEREPDSILGICDTKDRGTDFCFLPIFYQYGDKYYWEDCAYDNGAIEIVDELCAAVIIKHNPHSVQFESNSAGGRTADAINEKIKGKCRTRITKKFTTQNKETKIIVNSGWIKEHILIKDKSMYTPNSTYGKAFANLLSYTVSGKNLTDDVCDGMAMFAEYVAVGQEEPVIVGRRP
ncbi:MAG TPA: hypothetical protein O0Y05_03650, partial [Methanocorpusculum sp.]|nr:hypothetical protein [Methanocorpusculum sp.]